MYFQQLEALKDSDNISITDITLFDAVLFSVYEKGFHKRFNPRVYNQFEIQLNEQKWLTVLDALVQMGYLKKAFELCSPYSYETIEVYKEIDEIPLGTYKYSAEDDADFEVTENDIFITYSFNDLFSPLDSGSSGNSEKEVLSAKKLRAPNQGNLAPPGSEDSDLNLANLMQFYPEIVVDQYLEKNRERLTQMLDDVVLADSSTSKGNTLEDLIQHLLSFPYFKFYGKKVKNNTGEIDVIFNVKRTPSTLFEQFSDLLVVESKNWKDKAGAHEIRVFSDKMKDSKTNVGIFFSKGGVTGREDYKRDAKGVIRDQWRENGLIIIVISLDDLTRVIKEKYSLHELLRKKYYEVRLL